MPGSYWIAASSLSGFWINPATAAWQLARGPIPRRGLLKREGNTKMEHQDILKVRKILQRHLTAEQADYLCIQAVLNRVPLDQIKSILAEN